MPDHARLSPSGAERWINCPASIKLSEDFPDTTSPYAAEGTLAHEIAAKKLLNDSYAGLKKDPLYSQDMEFYTDEYLEYINNIKKEMSGDPVMQVETRLDLSFIAPKTFGTADCLLIHDSELHVIDFKYGKNVEVSSEENPQMMIYALGALRLYDGLIFNIKTVHLHIVQPRMNNFSSYTLEKQELEDWLKEVVRPAARKVLSGSDQVKCGAWCKFCRAKPVCREYGKRFNGNFEMTDPLKLTAKEIAQLIQRLKGLDNYLKTLQEYALSEALKGRKFPGLKVVEGRSTRQWKDQNKALKIAEAEGYEVYEKKPLSLAKIEKLMGAKNFKLLLGEEVIKPQGKPTLVPESDKREAFNSARDDFKDIEIKE